MTTRAIKAVCVAGVLAMAVPAMAGEFNFGLGINTGGTRVGVGVNVGQHVGVGVSVGRGVPVVPVRPVVAAQPVVVARPVAVARRVWVPAVYQVVTERVWVPTLETAYRDVPVIDAYGQVVSYQREAYTVNGGYWTTVQKQVLVREGYWRVAGGCVEVDRRYPVAFAR